MAENHAPRENGAGDDHTASISSDVRVHRAALLTAELAEICAKNMFTVRAEGPHATEAPTLAGRPTPASACRVRPVLRCEQRREFMCEWVTDAAKPSLC